MSTAILFCKRLISFFLKVRSHFEQSLDFNNYIVFKFKCDKTTIFLSKICMIVNIFQISWYKGLLLLFTEEDMGGTGSKGSSRAGSPADSEADREMDVSSFIDLTYFKR